MRIKGIVVAAVMVVIGLLVTAGITRSQAKQPKVVGNWTGTWGPFAPPKPNEQPKVYTAAQRSMDCKVELLSSGDWQATFEGECGRPYKYTIKMLGRTAGGVVLFQGSADLGEKDGGVYDWIGRATDKEFVGFYTSASHTGHFRLTRPGP